MSKNQGYGKTKLSDNHKKQLAKICASIITVAVSAGNPLVLAGATTTAAGSIYEFWKTKPDNDLCKKLSNQIEKIDNPDPEIIDHDMIESILIAAARKIQEKADKNDLLAYRENPDALFQEIWNERVHKDKDAERYYRDVLRVISSNIQVSEIEMQAYLLDMPTEIIVKIKALLDASSREQTEVLKQFIADILNQRNAPSDKTEPVSQADNQYYLNHFTEPLFLEEDEDEDDTEEDKKSKVTLASMYVSPHLKDKTESVADCITQWFHAKTKKTCMLLFGNAGVGKSSLVSKIIADANSSDANKEFQFRPDQVLAAALRNHCDEIDWKKHADKILKDLFPGYSEAEMKSKLLILDGLDEVCVLRGKDFNGHSFLAKLLELDEGFHVLVTSRDAKGYFEDPKDIKKLKIETLQWRDGEVETWCGKYCKAKKEKTTWCNGFLPDYKKLPGIDEKDHRKEVFCVPIILYICGDAEIKLSDHKNIGSIYHEAFRKILSREHLVDGKKIELKEADRQSNLIAWQYTKELAYQMFLLNTLDLVDSNDPTNKHAIGLENAKKRTKTVLQEKISSDFDVPDDALEIKKELALCPFTKGKGTGGITFAHKTVCEYFTAVKLYEDYFAKFNKSYFGSKKADEAAEDVIRTAIAAFRYHAISDDVFQHLCDMKEAPYSGISSEEFDADGFKTAFVHAMENRVLEAIEIKRYIDEYFISHGGFDPVNMHIVRAFQALLCFLTGIGFRNKIDAESCKQIRDMLTLSDQRVNLTQWHLQKADLQGANLQEANLQRADLQRANLQNSKLQWADLQGANLQEANLEDADLEEANLQEANLQGADLSWSDLQGANLQEANLQESDLYEVNLQDADLRGANLRDADLRGANLRGANLRDMDLRGANLQDANLLEAEYCTSTDEKTIFPYGFDPKAHGMIEVDINGYPLE